MDNDTHILKYKSE